MNESYILGRLDPHEPQSHVKTMTNDDASDTMVHRRFELFLALHFTKLQPPRASATPRTVSLPVRHVCCRAGQSRESRCTEDALCDRY